MTQILASIILAALCAFGPAPAQQDPNDGWKITRDEVSGGVRFVTAVPCNVCSRLIELEISVKSRTIRYCKFTRGCQGNTAAVGRLVEGLTVEQAVSKLDGIDCGGRGTSCPDQLARVLKSLKW